MRLETLPRKEAFLSAGFSGLSFSGEVGAEVVLLLGPWGVAGAGGAEESRGEARSDLELPLVVLGYIGS